MARPIVDRKPISRRRVPSDPRANVEEQWFWTQPKGIDLTSRLSRVDIQYSRDIQNMMLDDGSLRSRYGTTLFGSIDDDVMAIVSFTIPEGIGYLLRTTTTGLDRWNGSVWVPILDALLSPNIFTGTTSDYFSFANFGSSILIANGVDKLYSYDLVTGVHDFISDSVPSKHVTMFNGRVILSNTVEGGLKPYRIRWSVKNNSMDWTGDGSGYEDLFGAAGGVVDSAFGVYPVSDDTALIVRATSIWMMSVTGVLLAPFRFTRLWAEVGTKTPRSVATIPGGIVMLSREDVVALTPNDIRKIGQTVRHDILNSITDHGAVIGKYDYVRNEYRLAIGSTVWRYNFRDQGWTKDVYPFGVRDMTRAEIDNSGIAIDDLVGTIDSQVGTIDDLMVNIDLNSFLFVGI